MDMPTQIVQVTDEMKRNFLLERLKGKNVTVSKQGKLLHELDYNELKQEWALANYRTIEITNDANKWF